MIKKELSLLRTTPIMFIRLIGIPNNHSVSLKLYPYLKTANIQGENKNNIIKNPAQNLFFFSTVQVLKKIKYITWANNIKI
jgi:hypothetical protein